MSRKYWLNMLIMIANPVVSALAKRQLKAVMPIEKNGQLPNEKFAHLEALGRTLAGLAPWLESSPSDQEENVLRQRMANLSREAIDAATDPQSPDYVNFTEMQQPIVDAAFLCHAILRAPRELWGKLDSRVQLQLVNCLKATRDRKPNYNNWLLFSAIIEAALCRMGEQWDRMRVDYAIRQHDRWYKGDGIYGDGESFHWDYYNSFVIQPMLVDVMDTVGDEDKYWSSLIPVVLERASRYAEIQERLISPEGSYPPIGRSLAYRVGAFQHLAQMALQHRLPQSVTPAQVRCALTAVIQRQMQMPGTFDDQGWLKIGFCGSQPQLGESYISTGSLYLCTTGFLPLGLSEEDPFWSDPAVDWTSKRIWAGEDMPINKSIHS